NLRSQSLALGNQFRSRSIHRGQNVRVVATATLSNLTEGVSKVIDRRSSPQALHDGLEVILSGCLSNPLEDRSKFLASDRKVELRSLGNELTLQAKVPLSLGNVLCLLCAVLSLGDGLKRLVNSLTLFVVVQRLRQFREESGLVHVRSLQTLSKWVVFIA